MKFEIVNADGTIHTSKVVKAKGKKKTSEGSCGCCCASNSNANPNKRCHVCEDCTHVGECEEIYFYGRCVCGQKDSTHEQ